MTTLNVASPPSHCTSEQFTLDAFPVTRAAVNWDAMVSHLQPHIHPSDARRRMCDESLLLHSARHPATAEMLIHTHPDGVLTADKWGDLPLHRAIRWHGTNSVRVVRMLLGAERRLQESNSVNQRRKCGVLVKNSRGLSPLDISFAKISTLRLSRQCPEVTDSDGGAKLKALDLKRHKEEEAEWDKLCLIVKEAWSLYRVDCFNQNYVDEDGFNIVHALLGLEAPPAVIREGLRRIPDCLRLRDGRSWRLPLHTAVEKYAGNPHFQEVMTSLLDPRHGYPLAATVVDPITGLLPLHLAASLGITFYEGLDILLVAYPNALEMKDGKKGMYPFMHATRAEEKRLGINAKVCSKGIVHPIAIHNVLEKIPHMDQIERHLMCHAERNMKVDNFVDSKKVDVIYRLLREAPHVLLQ